MKNRLVILEVEVLTKTSPKKIENSVLNALRSDLDNSEFRVEVVSCQNERRENDNDNH